MTSISIVGNAANDQTIVELIDRRRAIAAQLAGVDMELAMAVGDRDAARRAMHEMSAQVAARHAMRFAEFNEKGAAA